MEIFLSYYIIYFRDINPRTPIDTDVMTNSLKLINYTLSYRFMGQWDITIQNNARVCMGNLTSEIPVSSRGPSKH
jgi:hypothetical protein